MLTTKTLIAIYITILALGSAGASAQPPSEPHWPAVSASRNFAPSSLAGSDVVLSIVTTESALPGGFPTMGAVVQSYSADGTYSYQGAGGPHHLTGSGTYKYTRTGPRTAVEEAVQHSDAFILPYVMEYTYTSSRSGEWVQYFADGLIVFRGTFEIAPTEGSSQWVPATLEGLRMSTTSDGRLAKESRRYSADTFSNCGKSSSGTYRMYRMSARSFVEEAENQDGSVYVRVYSFARKGSGRWHQIDAANSTVTTGDFRLSR